MTQAQLQYNRNKHKCVSKLKCQTAHTSHTSTHLTIPYQYFMSFPELCTSPFVFHITRIQAHYSLNVMTGLNKIEYFAEYNRSIYIHQQQALVIHDESIKNNNNNINLPYSKNNSLITKKYLLREGGKIKNNSIFNQLAS